LHLSGFRLQQTARWNARGPLWRHGAMTEYGWSAPVAGDRSELLFVANQD